jgi:hypothetical protein
MWIITNKGFVSVVQDNADDSKLCVRARRIEDLAPFDAEVVEHAGSDYQYRCTVDRHTFAEWMRGNIMSLDYTTHAKENMAGDDRARYKAYLNVWEDLAALQPQPPFSRSNA